MNTQEVEGDIDFDWEDRDEDMPISSHMIAGSLAGMIEHGMMFPLDTVKVRSPSAQTHMQALESSNSTFFNTVLELYSKEGILRFWSGMPALMLGVVPAHALYFSVYEIIRWKFRISESSTVSWIQPKNFTILAALAGAGATFSHDLILTPFDVIKQRLQLNSCQTLNRCIRKTVRKEGYRALFRSFPVTLMMNVPYHGTVVGCNENLKILCKPKKKSMKYFWYFFCAGLSGVVASFLTNPLDVVKTRIQTQLHEQFEKKRCDKQEKLKLIERKLGGKSRVHPQIKPEIQDPSFVKRRGVKPFSFGTGFSSKRSFFTKRSQVYYSNIHDTVWKIYQQEGPRGFMKGVLPRMISVVPSIAISWCSYEFIKNILRE